jgi:outer membrane lipoprotein carrier protein
MLDNRRLYRRLYRSALAALALVATLPATRGNAQSAPERSSSTSAAARFARIQQQYRAATSFRLDFQQTVTNPLTGSTSTSRGQLVSKRPNRFAITFSEPATGDKIVCDGESLWLYLPSSAPGQVIRMSVESQGSALADPVGAILSAPANHYRATDGGSATIEGHAAHAITLTPSAPDPLFTSATVWVNDRDGSLARVDTRDVTGVERKIVIVKQAKNVSIPSSAFTFTPPKGVRVVDQRVASGH